MPRKVLCVVLIAAIFLGFIPGGAMAWITQGDFIPCTRVGGIVTDTQVRFHRVAKGETLWSIARKQRVDLDALMAMNNLSSECTILEGQLIKVPYQRARVHKVRRGDTIWKIARMYEVNENSLLEANHIQRPECLKVGMSLYIPPSASVYEPRQERPSRGYSLSGLSWPLFGTITSKFGWRKAGFHHGLDIAAKKGSYIRAAYAGRVIFAGYKPVYGRTVVIQHAGNVKTVYGHAQRIMVKKGQRVKRGEAVATVGSSGRSTGPHLHFEVHCNGKAANPLEYLPR